MNSVIAGIFQIKIRIRINKIAYQTSSFHEMNFPRRPTDLSINFIVSFAKGARFDAYTHLPGGAQKCHNIHRRCDKPVDGCAINEGSGFKSDNTE